MGLDLFNKQVLDTYDAIIKVGDNNTLTGTPKLLSDGRGNDTPIYLGASSMGINITPDSGIAFQVNGGSKFTNITVTGTISSGNITTSGYLRGPETFIIDPSAYGNNTGLVQILGDLRVDGTTTTVNSTTVTINDKNIVLADEATTAGDADGAGITINGAGATLTYASATDDFHFNKNVNAGTFIGALTGNASTASKWATARTITIGDTGKSVDGSGNVSWSRSEIGITKANIDALNISSGYQKSFDTRAVASTPETNNATEGIRFDFKQNSTNGLSDGGTYNGVMYWRKYGSTTDWSGGGAKEIAYTDNGNLWHRYGTSTSWGSWRKILDDSNYSSILDARYYTETEIGNFFSGTTAITGYNKSNWDTAYGWGDWSTGVNKAFVDALNVDADTLDTKHATDFTLDYVTTNGSSTANSVTFGDLNANSVSIGGILKIDSNGDFQISGFDSTSAITVKDDAAGYPLKLYGLDTTVGSIPSELQFYSGYDGSWAIENQTGTTYGPSYVNILSREVEFGGIELTYNNTLIGGFYGDGIDLNNNTDITGTLSVSSTTTLSGTTNLYYTQLKDSLLVLDPNGSSYSTAIYRDGVNPHKFMGDGSGLTNVNATTASKWATARTITLGGDLTGNVSIDGSANVTLTAAVVDDSHNHDGRYYTETELDAGQLDNRYYTETESDAKYLLNTTDTLDGDLTVTGEITSDGDIVAGGTLESQKNPLGGGSGEGGGVLLRKATSASYSYQWLIDNYTDYLRFVRQDDGTAANGFVGMDLDTSGNLSVKNNLSVDGKVVAKDWFVSDENTSIAGSSPYDWVHLGAYSSDASRAAAVQIGDIDGARYAIMGGGYDLTFAKHLGTSNTWSNIMRFEALGVDSVAGVRILNDLTVDGDITALGTYNLTLGHDSTQPAIFADNVLRIMQRTEVFGGAGGYYLDVRNSSGDPRVRLYGSGGDSYFLDGLALGTTSANKILHIQSNDSAWGTMRLYRDSTTQGEVSIGFFDKSNGATNEAWVIGTGGWGHSGDFVIGNENGGAGGNVRLLVQRDGAVGIGTTSPSAKLEIFGTGNTLRLDSAANQSKTILLRNVGTATAEIKTDGNLKLWAEDAGRNIYFDTSSGTKVTVLSGGDVGIGTTSPSYKLHVAGSGSVIGEFRAGNNGWDNTPNGTNFSHTLAANAGTSRVVNFDGNGSSPSVWWTSQNNAIGAIDGLSTNNGLTFWSNSSSGAWERNFYFSNGYTRFERPTYFQSSVDLGGFSSSDSDQWPLITWHRDTGNNWDEGMIKGSSSRGVFGRSHFGIHMSDQRSFAFHSSGWDTEMEINGDGKIYQKGPVSIGTTVFGSEANLTIGGKSSNEGGQIALAKASSYTYAAHIDVYQNFMRILRGTDTSTSAVVAAFNMSDLSFLSYGDVIAYYSSDKRLKDNIKPIENAIDKVKKIGGYEFDWNDKQETYSGHDVGVIAQEIEEVLPEVVTERDNGYKAVKYEKLVALLIQGMKEQQEQIDELKRRLDGSTN